MSKIAVPSDISILEHKCQMGRKRRIRRLEKLGLKLMLPMIHCSHTRNDKTDLHRVLRRKFLKDDVSPENFICIARQESIRKEVLAKNGFPLGGMTALGMCMWSLRKYNYQMKLIVFPFAFYFGAVAGRIFANACAGRFREQGRDKFLGALPAKVWLNENFDKTAPVSEE